MALGLKDRGMKDLRRFFNGSRGHKDRNTGEESCREIRDLASDYLENELEEAEQARVRGHLALCPPCRAFLGTLQKTLEALRGLQQNQAPDTLKRETLRRLEEQ